MQKVKPQVKPGPNVEYITSLEKQVNQLRETTRQLREVAMRLESDKKELAKQLYLMAHPRYANMLSDHDLLSPFSSRDSDELTARA